MKQHRIDTLINVICEFEQMKKEKKADPCAYSMSLEDIQRHIDWMYSKTSQHIPRAHFSQIWMMVKQRRVDFPGRI
jgi:hypothetical protein